MKTPRAQKKLKRAEKQSGSGIALFNISTFNLSTKLKSLLHFPQHFRFPSAESTVGDVFAGLAYQPQKEGEVVQSSDLHPQNLAAVDQVPQVSFAVKTAAAASTFGVDGRKIVAPFGVAHVHDPIGGVQQPMPGIAAGQHTIEHVDAQGDALQEVARRTHAHEVTGLVAGQNAADQLGHGVHFFGGLAYRQAADRIGWPLKRCDGFGRLDAQVFVGAALHDGEKGLLIAVQALGFVKMGTAALEPAMGHFHRLLGVFVFARVGRTFVKSHDDVAADDALDVDGSLRTKQVLGAVDVRLESHPFFYNFTGTTQGIDLIAAAVGENGLVPAVEFVQPPHLLQNFGTRPQVQVVSIAQDDLGLDFVHQFVLVNGFDRTSRANGHENGGFNGAMCRLNQPGSGRGLWVIVLYGEGKRHSKGIPGLREIGGF